MTRGKEDAELHRRCGRPSMRTATGSRTTAASHDRLQSCQQQQRSRSSARGLPRCRTADCSGKQKHHRRHVREQSGRWSAEARARRTASVWPKHHRRLRGVG